MTPASNTRSSTEIYPLSDQDDRMDTDSTESNDQGSPRNGVDIEGPISSKPNTEFDTSVHMEISDDDSEPVISDPKPQLKRKRSGGSPMIEASFGNSSVDTNHSSSLILDDFQNQVISKRLRKTSDPQEYKSAIALSFLNNLDDNFYGLTIPLWQKIFCFVPPVFLGRLIRVCHTFSAILSPASSDDFEFQARIQIQTGFLPSETIWQASRKWFAPGIPKPLIDQQELSMWRLLRGNRCQMCGAVKKLSTTYSIQDPWRAGPDADEVRIIWIFGIRICGPCLVDNCQQV
jgi:hypothetical protein